MPEAKHIASTGVERPQAAREQEIKAKVKGRGWSQLTPADQDLIMEEVLGKLNLEDERA